MKNLFKNLMLVAVAAMAFTACTEEQSEVNATKNGTVLTFTANFADDTRVVFEDVDGTYKASFEAFDSKTYTGDRVTFAAYNGDQLIDDVEVGVSESGKTATFVVKFEETLEPNYTIVAHLNKYFNWEGNIDYYGGGVNTQTPDENGMISNIYATSAPIVYGEQENLNLTFNYDHAFGKVTFKNDLDLEDVNVTVKSGDDTYNYTLREIGSKKSVMFNCEPVAKVDYIKFYANVVEGEGDDATNVEYIFEKENPANGELAFVAGRVSAFNVTLAKEVREPLATPEVTAELDVNGNLVFSWEAVDGAGSYDVSLDYADAQTQVETNYIIAAAELKPLTTYRVSVVANPEGAALPSASASAEFTTSVNKDAEGDTGFDFGYNQVEKLGENWYKFSSTEHSYYMTLSFNGDNIENITAGESKVYSTNDGTLDGWNGSGYNESLFTCQYEQSGYEGWFFQGENTVFVDRLENNDFQITAFCKRGINVDYDPWTIYPLFKGSWSGTFEAEEPETLATPENLKATYSDGNVEVTWDAVTKAEKYSVDVNGTTFTSWVNNTSFLAEEPGTYTISVVAVANGYNNSEAATVTVEVEEQGVVEPEVVEFTSVTVEAVDSNLNFHNLTFTDGTYTAVIKLATRGTTEYVAGNYDQNGSFNNADYLYIDGSVTDNTWNGADCWPVTMEVIDNGDGTATFNLVYNEYPSAVQHKGTYTGVLEGLTLVDPEQSGGGEESGDVITVKILKIAVGYDQPGEKEMQFWYSATNAHVIDFKGMGNCTPKQPLAAGDYSSANYTIDENYSIFDYGTTNGTMSSVECTVTNNTDGTQTYDAKFVYNGQKYAFVYTGNYPA